MKYTCSIIIDKPIDFVVSLWKDENQFGKWQEGFQHIKHLKGKREEVGSKSEILIIQGKNKIELIETILISNLPKEKKGLYEHKHMINTQSSRFVQLEESKTQYISIVEYTQFNGLIIKIMAKLFPTIFKKQSEKWMDNFKKFAESHP